MKSTLDSILTMNLQKGDRIAVAMSGGVDSSVAACLCQEMGFDVVGITLQLYDQGDNALLKKKACCAGQDIYDARTVADKMGFPHYVLDFESVFKASVIDDFADSYLKGETPIPCVRCNQRVKFRDLMNIAKDLDAKALITGHYVRQKFNTDSVTLHKAIDLKRDQSYFLFATTRDQLDFLRFPLGNFSKDVTRQHARRFGLDISEKPDSQDICFVPSTPGGYKDVVAKLRPGALDPGKIIHIDGRVLGEHQGIIHFTVGQRKGLKIAFEEPLFVISLNAAKKEVVVGPREALSVSHIFLKEMNWLDSKLIFESGRLVEVKFRSQQSPIAAYVFYSGETQARIDLLTPEYGIASGQACVLYEDTQVLGGGWITSTANHLT